MTQDTVQEIDQAIQRERQHIDLAKALDRLFSNRDFKQVVVDGYLTSEAVRLVHLKADPALQRPESQASITAQIDAIGGLMSYFRMLRTNGTMAARAIEDHEVTRQEILAEESGQ